MKNALYLHANHSYLPSEEYLEHAVYWCIKTVFLPLFFLLWEQSSLLSPQPPQPCILQELLSCSAPTTFASA